MALRKVLFPNLEAEFTRRNVPAYVSVMQALGCSEKTARNKLNGTTGISLMDCIKIKNKCFPYSGFSLDYAPTSIHRDQSVVLLRKAVGLFSDSKAQMFLVRKEIKNES
ncbi:MAG: hypothetical protein ACI4DP_03250 [Candidatus Ornithomonoglobus sp.]